MRLTTLQTKLDLKTAKLANHATPSARILLAGTLTLLALSGCQPQSEPVVEEESVAKVAENTEEDITKVIHPEVLAAINSFEAEFISKMLTLQQSQLSEYEALQAADAPEDSLTAGQEVAAQEGAENAAQPASTQEDSTANTADTDAEFAANDNADKAAKAKERANKNDEPVEASKVTLEDLPLATNVVIEPPKILTAAEISSRYKVAMQSLYLPENVPLPAQAVDTLLNIATLTPDVFSNPELAQRLVVKSPALARLLRQYQTWEQIEIQQSEELEAVKQAQIDDQKKQSEEFDSLVKEFTDKIESYDKQIAKYEEMLKKLE